MKKQRTRSTQGRQPGKNLEALGLAHGSAGAACLIVLVAILLARYNHWYEPEAYLQSLVYHDRDGHVEALEHQTQTQTHSSNILAQTSALRPNTNVTCCLAMIIKNEGPIMPRVIESVKGFASEYCIVDTGSTDDTIEVVKSMDMPGVIFEEPFVDFATTRNFMMDRCREASKADYLLLLDADMVLHVSNQWDWAELDGKDVYNLIQYWGVEYENVRLVRREATADIRVVGSTHEYYHVPSHYSHGLLPKHLVYIEDVGDGKAKADKFERDERLLRKDLAVDPNNGRTIFYLGNTLKALGRYEEAIELYKQRANMSGWFADRDYSVYQISTCYLAMDKLDDARAYAEMAAFDGATPRAEPLYELVFYLHRHENYPLAWYYLNMAERIPKPQVAHALFIANDVYDYWLAYERATLCRHVMSSGDLQSCTTAAIAFLNNVYAPDHLREHFVQHELSAGMHSLIEQGVPIEGNNSDHYDGLAHIQTHSKESEDASSSQGPLSVFTVHNATYCVEQWYPLAVGDYDARSAECRPFAWYPNVPRSLFFMTIATNGAVNGNEVWFLARWATDANGSAPVFSFIILRDNGKFKAQTTPFTLELDHVISIGFSNDEDDGSRERIDVVYRSTDHDCRERVNHIPLMDVYRLFV